MKTSKVSIPMMVALGCNNKAKMIICFNYRVLYSYGTPIAMYIFERHGDCADWYLYRLADASIISPTTLRHWKAFCEYFNRGSFATKKAYAELPFMDAVMTI